MPEQDFSEYFRQNDLAKLHVGCGNNRHPGWLDTDIDPGPGVFFLDASKPFPFKGASFDYIYSEHVIEHLEREAAQSMLRESYRILKPGGRMRISTPDIEFFVGLYKKDKSEAEQKYIRWIATALFPDVDEPDQEALAINTAMRGWYHKFLYDGKLLGYELKRAGFTDVQQYVVGESDDPNLRGVEAHGSQVGDDFNALESLILEGMKPSDAVIDTSMPAKSLTAEERFKGTYENTFNSRVALNGGDYVLAAALAEKALTFNPRHQEAIELLAAAQRELGKKH